MRQHGFTLVEIMLVIALISVLGGLMFVNLIRPQTTASLNGFVSALMADIKSQQTKAMAGDTFGASTAQAYGIYLQSASYTLFKGTAYSGADTDNFVVAADPGIAITSTFPSSQVVFTKGTGEVSGFTNGSNTITITRSPDTKIITINRFGVITVN